MELDDRELLEELIIESQEHLSTLEPDLMTLEKQPGPEETAELVNRIFRAIHSIKGGCGFLGISPAQNLTHAMESVLMKVRSGLLEVTPVMIDVMLEGADKVRDMLDDVDNCATVDASTIYAGLEPFLGDVDTESPPAPEEPAAPAVAEPVGIKKSGYIPLVKKPVAPEPEVLNEIPTPAAKADSAAPPVTGGGRSGHSEVLRVKVDLLNQLMNLAGELVLARNQIVQSLDGKLVETSSGEAIFSQTQAVLDASFQRLKTHLEDRRLHGQISDETVRQLDDALQHEYAAMSEGVLKALPSRISELPGINATMVNIDAVTTNLQENIMRTRLQSIDAVFGKLPRQVRKLAKQVGKDVDLHVSGNEVELDKSIIESLSDPLNHLIRNSLDHGLEHTADRLKAGKSRAGQLSVRAFHEGGQVKIEIKDDGWGINPQVILAKALEKGILTAEQAAKLDDREAVALIFAPGFSTAETVSDVSGRGVGMDVVRTNIENLGGRVDVDSELGRGTRMTLVLPLTLAIIPSLLVKVGGRRFAVPQVSLDELVRIRPHDKRQRLENVQGAEVFRLRDKLLPLVRLSRLLQMESDEPLADQTAGATYILVLKTGVNRYGLVVDEVLDSEEIVVKQMPSALKDTPCYAGATIMGDGTVAMILDVDGIADFAELRLLDSLEADTDGDLNEAYLERTESQVLLLFRNAPNGENFALNLAMISRIEKIKSASIERANGREFLRYDDRSLRLLRLHDFLPVAGPEQVPEDLYVIIPKMVKHPMGIIAYECEDVVTTRAEVERSDIKGPGLLGSSVIDGKLTLILDIFSLLEQADPELYRRQTAGAPSLASARILLAEDTSFFRAVEKSYLEGFGATVTAVKDGREAWQILQDGDQDFDLVVTDIEMPLMDGLELTRAIRRDSRYPDIPIIALTSLGSQANREVGLEAGVTAYESKLDKDRLAATLAEIMKGVIQNV